MSLLNTETQRTLNITEFSIKEYFLFSFRLTGFSVFKLKINQVIGLQFPDFLSVPSVPPCFILLCTEESGTLSCRMSNFFTGSLDKIDIL